MRRLGLIICFMTAVAGASAQHLHIDVRAGVTASTVGNQRLKMGGGGGVAVGYLFGDHLGLRSGLFYAGKGTSLTNNVFAKAGDEALRTGYLELPVELLGSIGISPNTQLELHGGLYVAGMIHKKSPDEAVSPHTCDMGVQFGFDFAIGRFVVGPQVQYGLTKVFPGTKDHNTTYSLTLGYRFGKKSR